VADCSKKNREFTLGVDRYNYGSHHYWLADGFEFLVAKKYMGLGGCIISTSGISFSQSCLAALASWKLTI
jgi:hypothetical protein